MSLTLTPVLIQCVSWGTYFIGGLTALLLIIQVIWHSIRPQRSMPSVRSAPPSVSGPGLASKPLKWLNRHSKRFDAPLLTRWKNGRRLPRGTGNLGRKLLNESSISYEGPSSGKGGVDLQGLGEAMKRQLNRKPPSAW